MPSEQEKRNLALTIAGEIHPGMAKYGTELAREEIANILASIENRYDLGGSHKYATRSDVVKAPKQYSTWNREQDRQKARENYAQFGSHIDAAVEDFYSGKLNPTLPHATNYWSPAGMRAITDGARSNPRWAPSIVNRAMVGPHVFGTHESPVDDHQALDIDSRIAAAHLGAPAPTGKGISQDADALRSIMYEPGSGDMGLLDRQEPAWSDQFAPGPKAAPKSALPQPTRSDYPTSPLNPELWQDMYAPAPHTASSERMDKGFAQSIPMAQAGVGSVGGRAAQQSQAGFGRFGPVYPRDGLSTPSQSPDIHAPVTVPVIDSVPTPETRPSVSVSPAFTPPVPSNRPLETVPFKPPVPRARPRSVAQPSFRPPVPTARPPVPASSTVPIPTPRPATLSAVPMAPPQTQRSQARQQP